MRTLIKIIRLPARAVRVVLRRPAAAEGAPAGPPPKRRGLFRRVALVAGTLSAIAGGSLFAVGVLDYFKGDAEAPDGQRGVVLAYRDDPGGVYDRPVVTPVATATPQPTPVGALLGAPAPPRESRYRMAIDSIGVDARVFTYGLDENQIPEVPLNGWDVAWYDFSSAPGNGSNAVFAGHVTWNGRAVFWYLNTLAVGDQIRLIGDDGSELVYTVSDTFMVDPDAPDAIQVMLGTSEDVITIITCDGTPFYIGGSFGYDYTARRVVRAALSNASHAPAAQPLAVEAPPAETPAPEPVSVGG